METDTAPQAAARRRHAIAAGVAGIALLGALVAHAVGPVLWEQPIIAAAVRMPPPGANWWIVASQPAPFAVATLVLAWVAAAHGRRLLAFAGAGGCFAAVASAELILKPLVDRRRRAHVVKTVHVNQLFGRSAHVVHQVRAGSAMFPSSHVTAAAAWATFAWLVFRPGARWISRLLVLIPLVTAWAVVATHMHYPADVAAGLLVGPVAVLATLAVVEVVFQEPARSRRRDRLPSRV